MGAIADAATAGFSQDLKISRQAGNAMPHDQQLEFAALRQATVTLSFWAKAGHLLGGA